MTGALAFRLAAAMAFALALAPAADAQDRAPAQRQALSDLARLLGQSHALRRACGDAADLYWYARMQQLLELEAPDQGLKKRLILSFNAGYAGAQASFPSCTAEARAEAGRVAAGGKVLAGRLASP